MGTAPYRGSNQPDGRFGVCPSGERSRQCPGTSFVQDAPQLCWNARAFKPNFYVDISPYLEKKLEAFRCHTSQQRPDPHNGGVENLRCLARSRGREISVEAAEAYECLRAVL